MITDRRGPEVDEWIKRIEAAVEAYPYKDYYRTWPGPNSNTFVAHIGRSVPELRLDLPPTAIGKDYLPDGAVFARTPSGTGVEASLFGVLGILGGWEEGVELNVLGLTFGLDLNSPALKLPVWVGWVFLNADSTSCLAVSISILFAASFTLWPLQAKPERPVLTSSRPACRPLSFTLR